MLKKIIIALVILLVGIQFYRPAKNISEETPTTDFLVVNNADESMATLIKNACYDCHSNNTNYPWYSEVAPFSWWIADHVKHGKEELNFSEWSTFTEKKKNHKLKEIIEEVEKRKMPLESYLPMHPEANLTDDQIKQLTDWVRTLQQ
ncbi:MAG: heme-binding domain-containing protein [Flavobacteriaceae bacterium]|nr:heme-binding domain-containing protein [Flavobacteriaceae bacterium]